MLRILTIGVSALTFAGYIAPYVDAYRFWPLAFLGLAYPFFALANLVLIFVWLLRKKKLWVFLPLLTLLLGGPYFKGFFGARGFGERLPEEASTRVVSYNIRRFQPYGQAPGYVIGSKDWKKELAALQADVLLLQEYDHTAALDIAELCAQQGLVHRALHPKQALAIFSRYPILQSQVAQFGGDYGFRYADIEIRNQILRFYTFHLQSNAITGMAERVAEHADLKEKRTWLTIRGMLGRYRRTARLRQQQAQRLADHVRQSPHPVILGGDLNDIPQSRVYHLVRMGLVDAFLKKGSGWGVTYVGRIPALRIDFILTDAALSIKRCTIGKTGFSDHRPVIADFVH